MRKQLLFFSLLTLTACGQQTQQTSDTSALVSQQQAAQAFSIVKAIDYIPFTFIEDGCYARSLYMSLELAAKGIPSSAHYVTGYLQPTSRVTWSYHVAPLLQLRNSSQEPWVLDPAFEEEPLTRSQWLKKNFAASKNSLVATAASTKTYLRAGSAYFDTSGRVSEFDTEETLAFTPMKDSSGTVVSLNPKPINPSVLIPEFADMPSFLSSDIHSACTVMYDYILRENVDDEDEKVERLLSSTTRLIKSMYSLKKLTRDGVSSYWGTAAKSCTSAMTGYYN
ncbi:MAG TPA: protein-glutamine glutaminase family protein [Oligoflexus sp.]|uniref:protein-glutamine glutaminase family protein n=1 Tax=Oligoflexus sp. TaxID=1971216 RepID=UPI002D667721|nr:protein-glutamine glutaminase family protein [Oligoflexus sp.]HYX35298.1 protein-glutamine glutaminase family protein [Oligoflexus sp.]